MQSSRLFGKIIKQIIYAPRLKFSVETSSTSTQIPNPEKQSDKQQQQTQQQPPQASNQTQSTSTQQIKKEAEQPKKYPAYKKEEVFEDENEKDLKYYKTLRIYRDCTNIDLANMLFCNQLMRQKFFVMNAFSIYKITKKVLGSTITEKVIKSTFGKIFTGGSTFTELKAIQQKFESKNIATMIDYCAEATDGMQTEFFMDKSANMFKKSIDYCCDKPVTGYISVKYSGLCDIDCLKKLNKFTLIAQGIFSEVDKENKGTITGAQLLEYFNGKNFEVNEQDVLDFLKQVFFQTNFSNQGLAEISISKLDWRIFVHAYYVDESKNQLKIAKKICLINEEEIGKFKNFVRRCRLIFDYAYAKKVRVLADAEQTFIQNSIDSFTEQFQFQYNKDQATIYSTYQNYLKNIDQRIQYEIEKCKRLNVPFIMKFVRGAYVYEENDLAKAQNKESPICDGIRATSKMMDKNIEYAISNWIPNSELLIGTHNMETLRNMQAFMKQKNFDHKKNVIRFAQLMGLADHATYSLLKEGYNVYKYVPFGETDIMMPYLCRRTEESYQVLSSVHLQANLIKDEIYKRTPFNS